MRRSSFTDFNRTAMKMSRESYSALIDQDISVIESSVGMSFERDHIISVLKKSIQLEYPDQSETDISARVERFKIELSKYIPLYGRDMLNEFFAYWTEGNRSGRKMRFELEKTWDTKRRLDRWAKNNQKFNRNGIGNTQNERGKFGVDYKADILGRMGAI